MLDRYQRLANTQPFSQENFLLGKKLAAGGFGTVYKADLVRDNDELQPVIVKKVLPAVHLRCWRLPACQQLGLPLLEGPGGQAATGACARPTCHPARRPRSLARRRSG